MKRALVSVCLVFLVGNQSLADDRLQSTFSEITAEQWREDLNYLSQQLPKRHRDLYHAITKEALDSAFLALENKLDTLTGYEYITEFARLMALIGDMHTSLSPGTKVWLPLSFYTFGDELYVIGADSTYSSIIGQKISHFESTPANQVIESLNSLFPHENETSRKEIPALLANRPELLVGLNIAESSLKVTLHFETHHGADSLTIVSTTEKPNPQKLLYAGGLSVSRTNYIAPEPESNYIFVFIEESHTAYVQFNQVMNSDDGETIPEFFERVYEWSQTHDFDRFVLDLRHNGGGNDPLYRPILALLASRPINRPGKFFTLIGRHVASAAQHLVNDLEYLTHTIFVGEPTSQNVNFFSDSRAFRLPNSNLRVRTSVGWLQNYSPSHFDTRDATYPQIAVEPSLSDFKAGRDPAFEAVLAYQHQEPLPTRLKNLIDSGMLDSARVVNDVFVNDPKHKYADFENSINFLGYDYLQSGNLNSAALLFSLNVESHPNSANCHDSMGECLLLLGDTARAISHYKKTLELSPDGSLGDNARKVLLTLGNFQKN